MMTASGNVSLRPPSSGSRSPSPAPIDAGRAQASAGVSGGLGSARQSMGPGARPTGFAGAPLSPRPGGAGGARPTSELLGNNVNINTPEAEAIDQWFENLQNYEATLEEMAAASLDVNFKEELSAIEQWFKVLSEAERTAALYSLLQHSTQVQIRFFITVLQQMARSDPMTALLSPAVGGSMQQQMEAKLAQMALKSPGPGQSMKSGLPPSPVARSFSGSAASRGAGVGEPPQSPGFLSPDVNTGRDSDAAGVLAQKRAQLKATNAAHRISAPALSTLGGSGLWGANGTASASSSLDNVAEKQPPSPTQELTVPTSNVRPKSTDFSGLLRSPRPGQETSQAAAQEAVLSPMAGDSWASMVNTPLIPMFQNTRSQANLDAAAQKLNEWNGPGAPGANGGNKVPMLDDAKKFRRVSKDEAGNNGGNNNSLGNGTQRTTSAGSWRGGSGGSNAGGNGLGNGANWTGSGGAKSPALSAVSSSRMAGSDDGSMAGLGMGGFPGMGVNGMGSPGLMGMGVNGMPGLNGMAGMQGMQGMNPFMLNMANMAQMGITPEAQLLAAQMAASGFVGQAAGLSPFGNLAALQAQQLAAGAMGGRGGMQGRSGRSPGGGARAPASVAGSAAGGKRDEEDVDPRMLEDVPAWLRSLRLHKYTPNFEGMNWRDMVMMDESALEAKGVAALGARRKMLKTFEVVRKKMGIEEPAGASE